MVVVVVVGCRLSFAVRFVICPLWLVVVVVVDDVSAAAAAAAAAAAVPAISR